MTVRPAGTKWAIFRANRAGISAITTNPCALTCTRVKNSAYGENAEFALEICAENLRRF